jgi:hypothetical protein
VFALFVLLFGFTFRLFLSAMGNNVGGLNYRTGGPLANAEDTQLFKERYDIVQAQQAYAFGDVATGAYYEDQAMRAGERAERIHDRRFRMRRTVTPWAHGCANTINPMTGIAVSPLGTTMYSGGMAMGGSGMDMGTLPMILPGMGPQASNFQEYTQTMMGPNAYGPTIAGSSSASYWGHSATLQPPAGAAAPMGSMMGGMSPIQMGSMMGMPGMNGMNGMMGGMGGYW